MRTEVFIHWIRPNGVIPFFKVIMEIKKWGGLDDHFGKFPGGWDWYASLGYFFCSFHSAESWSWYYLTIVKMNDYFKIRTKYDFSKKLKKKFLDAAWKYWRYLEVSLDPGGHFLSLGCLIWSPPKKFLQHKLEGYWKYEVLSEYSIPILSFIFQKSQLFSLFPTYNLIGVSYGHDFFTGAKIQPLQTFQIPRTCS